MIIDAGHGGRDGGAKGRYGILEKKLTLQVAKRVARLIKVSYPGLRVFMTRTKDRYVSLDGRTRVANNKYRHSKNGLFISIHGNTTRNRRVYGFETYYLSESNQTAEARRLAAFENRYLTPKTPYNEVKSIESTMLMAQITRESRRLALQMDRSLRKSLKGRSKSRGVKGANLHVLRGSLMPAILLEIGFISNRRESGLLKSGLYLDRISRAVTRGVGRFIRTPPKSY